MEEIIAEMEEERALLKSEVDEIRLKLAERNLWSVRAKSAERIKNEQIQDLTSGIATLKKAKKKKEGEQKDEANRQLNNTRHRLMVSEFHKLVDPELFQSVVDKVEANEQCS